jgi:hypothetical protein
MQKLDILDSIRGGRIDLARLPRIISGTAKDLDALSTVKGALLTLIDVAKQVDFDRRKFLVICREYEHYLQTGDSGGIDPEVLLGRFARCHRTHYELQEKEFMRVVDLLWPKPVPSPPDWMIKALWRYVQRGESWLLTQGRKHFQMRRAA